MSLVSLDTFAIILATYTRQRLADVHRAALLVRSSTDGSVIAAVFGNDDYTRSGKARQEVELVRQQLRDAAVEELAFGLSPDGYSWAMLVKADNHGFQTQVGMRGRPGGGRLADPGSAGPSGMSRLPRPVGTPWLKGGRQSARGFGPGAPISRIA
jgi:hypothetical protein